MTINKLTSKPTDSVNLDVTGKFEKFNLTENPFPATPYVNAASSEAKLNGSIFEIAIREKEFKKIEENFLKIPQSNLDHLRLGFINDTSYIGRGNGKSAFLVYLLKKINENYSLDISDKKNKCFGLYVVPEGGGKIKTFDKFVDLFFHSIIESNIINVSLATIRLEAITKTNKKIEVDKNDFDEIIKKLNSTQWFSDNRIDVHTVNVYLSKNKFLKELPPYFPLFTKPNLFYDISDQKLFEEYYDTIKKPSEKYEFIFSHLVNLFLAAGFNGAYALIDDFERIPDFQSAIQKKDFATQLRTILFDGLYMNSKLGFYNFILALHAGVPRLMEEAWNLAGMENRVPINPPYDAKNVIAFEKLNEKHAVLLIKKYLHEYRIKSKKQDELYPFNEKAIKLIGEISEYNAASILRFAHNILDQAAKDKVEHIDEKYVNQFKESRDFEIETGPKNIIATKTVDLKKKAKTKPKA